MCAYVRHADLDGDAVAQDRLWKFRQPAPSRPMPGIFVVITQQTFTIVVAELESCIDH